MDWLTRLFTGISATLTVVGFSGVTSATPVAAPTLPVATILEAPSPVSVAPTTTLPASAHCPQWWGLAADAGWEAEQMEELDYFMWRESRCDPTQHNTTLNRDGSTDIGLLQVNDRSWCLPTRWYPDGYLQTVGILSTVGSCAELFNPYLNLLAAKALYDYSQEATGDGFHPWK
jgi:hypothetical protein